jgi:hypothetical protein
MHNQLVDINDVDASQTPNLIKLSLSGNSIQFENNNGIFEMVKLLATYPKLGLLDIDDNPFW